MSSNELAELIKTTILDAKIKKVPIVSLTKNLGIKGTTVLIKNLLKYGKLSYDTLEELGNIINRCKNEYKSIEIETTEQKLISLQEKLKKLKGE